jgi:phosphohistidine phosphatase SixA
MTTDRGKALARRIIAQCLGLLGPLTLAACVADREPAKADFYVMRHLQEETGADPGLTPVGRFYAERLVYSFGTYRPRAIYVSTTRRAHETAARVAAKWELKPKHYDPSIRPI